MGEFGPDLIRKFLQSLDVGLDTNSQELQETPARVWQAWRFFTSGYSQDPAEVLKTFDEGYDELIFQSALPFYSMCAHHMIPFHGLAHIAYLPNGKIVGLSKLARLLEVFARRLTIQERIGVQVADALMRYLDARGAAVVLQCRHMCMEARGVQKTGTVTMTSAMRGRFMEQPALREEFMLLVSSAMQGIKTL